MRFQSSFMLDGPALILRLVVERLGEGADLGTGEALSGSLGIFALGVVMQQDHHEPSATPGVDLLQHLAVAG